MTAVTSEVVALLGYGFIVEASITASMDAELSGTAVRVRLGEASPSADVTLRSRATRVALGAAALTADVALSSAGTRVRFGDVSMSSDADATLSASVTRVTFASTDVLFDEVSSFTGTPGPVFRLRMATAKRAITDDWLLRRYPIDVGLSLLVKGSTVTEVEVPSQTELAEADYYFLGGRDNPITPAQRAVLIAAGFGSYIEED